MDLRSWIELAFAVLAAGAFAVAAAGAYARRGDAASDPGWPPADREEFGRGRAVGDGDFALSPNAGRLLGLLRRGCASAEEIAARAGAEQRQALLKALRDLSLRGASFSTLTETVDGRALRIIGEARGAAAGLFIVDQTELRRRADRLEADRDAAERLADRLAAGFEARDELVWVAGPSGAPIWRSKRFDAAPDALRQRLLSSRPAGRRARLKSEDGAAPVYDMLRCELPNDETLYVASETPAQQAEDAAFARFVNTMSETFAHLKVGLMIFDQDRRLILFNPATVKLFAAEISFLARRPSLKALLDDMREARTIPDQTDYAAWRDKLLARLSTEGGSTLDEQWHLADGRTIHVVARPHPTGGLAVTAEDITESVALKRSNAAERAVLLATTEFLDEGLVVFGPDGLARQVNESFRGMWGLDLPPDGALRHIAEISEHCARITADQGFWPQVAASVTGGPERRSFKLKLPLTDGRVLYARYSPMPDGSSLLVFADVSASERVAEALRERNEALEHTDELRAALVDQISRQIQGPLGSIASLGQALNDELKAGLSARQVAAIDGVVAASGDLLDAISGVADLVSMDAERLGAAGETFSPAIAAAEAVSLSTRRARERDSRVEADYGCAPRRFRANKIRFRQVVYNMLSDALAMAPAGAEVALELSQDGGELVAVCAHAVAPDGRRAGPRLAIARRFADDLGGGLSEIREDGRRRLICRIPEGAADAPPGPLLAEEPLAAAE